MIGPYLTLPLTSTKRCLSDVIHRALLRVCKPTTFMALPVMCRHRRAVLGLISTIHRLLNSPPCSAASSLNLLHDTEVAPVGTVGRGTALQAGRSQVQFPLILTEFFIDLILSAAVWPCVPPSL